MPFLVQAPIRFRLDCAAGIGFDLGVCAEVAGDETAQMVGIICGIANDMPDTSQSFNEPTRLRAVGPLAGGDRRAIGQTERIHRRMDLGPLSHMQACVAVQWSSRLWSGQYRQLQARPLPGSASRSDVTRGVLRGGIGVCFADSGIDKDVFEVGVRT